MTDSDPTDPQHDDEAWRDAHTADERTLSEPGDAEHGYRPLNEQTIADEIRAFAAGAADRAAHRAWTATTRRALNEHGDDDPPAPAA